MKTLGTKLNEAYHGKGIEEVRRIVYGNGKLDFHQELEGMRLFILSRQKHCADSIEHTLEQ
jgi:hypothetical protein